MTRYEYLKNASIEEMAEVFCNITDNTDCGSDDEYNNCMGCLATKYCHNTNGEHHNGFIDWLNKEVEYCENTKDVKVWD